MGALRQEIAESKAFLDKLSVRPDKRVVDHALARYLWGAIQIAEVVELACEGGHPAGTAPLRRHLLEAVIDTFYIVSSDDPKRDAMKSIVWDVIDWDRVWDHHEAAVALDPSLDTGNSQAQSREEVFTTLRAEMEALGEDLALFDEVVESARAPRLHWHWSGKGPSGRLSELDSLVSEGDARSDVVAMLRGIWKLLSSSSHPSPAWLALKIDELADGTLGFPATETGAERNPNVASNTANMLQMCRALITGYRELVEEG